MTLTSLKVAILNAIKKLSSEREKNAMIYANELIALINDRLESKGTNAEGVKFPGYSEKPLAWDTAVKIIMESNRPSAAKSIKPGKTSYKDLRKLIGLPVDRRTHVFTGNMLKSIRPEVIKNDEATTIIKIKPASKELQDRINQNSKRMKINLLKPSDEEVEFLNEANRQRIMNIL